MKINNKEEKFSNVINIDSVRRNLENMAGFSNKNLVKNKITKNSAKRRWPVKGQNIMARKQPLEECYQKIFFQEFSENNKYTKYNRYVSMACNKDEKDMSFFHKLFQNLLKSNKELVEKIFDLQKRIEHLSFINGQLLKQINHIAVNRSKDHSMKIESFQDNEEEVVNELGQKPVKWWIRKFE